MRTPPAFFEAIRQKAAARWDQLEGDPELAAPWWQLFQQVQSPRHVISELLQNAEDAGASWASARIEGEQFVFEHDGHDFTEDEFQSICRFGCSNKRSLLTIGFRGIGFRSLFSLGPTVHLATPTIACRFERGRFTEPVWDVTDECRATRISCRIATTESRELVDAELSQWAASPTPLLFFDFVRELRLGPTVVSVQERGEGPCEGSTSFAVSGHDRDVVVIRSSPVALPAECLAEIRSERGGQDLQLPPIAVAVVLGSKADGRLHAFLPTDVQLTGLPVAVHAPFLQDPARVAIKDLANSPTNRWLLRQVGGLLGASIQHWLSNPSLSLADRAAAYELLPGLHVSAGSGLAAAAEALVKQSLAEVLAESRATLCSDGEVRGGKDACALPAPVLRVWQAEDALSLCGADRGYAVAEEAGEFAARLFVWSLCTRLSLENLMTRLRGNGTEVPPPVALAPLLALWAACEAEVARAPWRWTDWWREARITPTLAGRALRAARELLATVPSKPARVPDELWAWLLAKVDSVDRDFATLAKSGTTFDVVERECRSAEIAVSEEGIRQFRRAFEAAGLTGTSSDSALLKAAANRLRSDASTTAEDWMRLMRLAFALDVDLGPVGEDDPFRLVARNGRVRRRTEVVAGLPEGPANLFPASWRDDWLLSDTYESGMTEAEVLAWRHWLRAPDGARLAAAPLPHEQKNAKWLSGRERLERFLRDRGGQAPSGRLPYQRESFWIKDWNWDSELVAHWNAIEAAAPSTWAAVTTGLLRAAAESESAISPASLVAIVQQEANQGSRRTLDVGRPRAAWVDLLRGKECLRDELGQTHTPEQLLRRTPDTDALIGIERFVSPDLDREGVAAILDAIGVRATATGAQPILARLRDLSGTDVPVGRVRDLYRALERVVGRYDEERLSSLRATVRDLPIIRTVGGWRLPRYAFRANPDGLPGVEVLHPMVADLLPLLWDRLEVRSEPTSDDVLSWIASWASGVTLPDAEREAVRRSLRKWPLPVWTSTGRWMSALGQLVDTRALQLLAAVRKRGNLTGRRGWSAAPRLSRRRAA